MTRLMTIVLFTLLVCCVGCGKNKIDSKLDELSAKPAASSLGDAKALYEEASNFESWIEQKEKPTEAQLETAKKLTTRRRDELVKLAKDEGVSIASNAVDILKDVTAKITGGDVDVKSASIGGAFNWFTGVNSPRMKEFGCPPTDQPLKNGRSRECK